MKDYKDNSINIGNNNKIKNSNIGNNSCLSNKEKLKEKWYQKITWNIIIPIVVGIAIAVICVWLGIDK